jgi:hypothetical protein
VTARRRAFDFVQHFNYLRRSARCEDIAEHRAAIEVPVGGRRGALLDRASTAGIVAAHLNEMAVKMSQK